MDPLKKLYCFLLIGCFSLHPCLKGHGPIEERKVILAI